MKPTCLVVPSIREGSLARFVREWNAVGLFDFVDLYVVEDNPQRTFTVNGPRAHFDWDFIDRTLGDEAWIIPRRSDTVRSFGYYMAWRDGYPYILTLDDDCYPPDGVTGSTFIRAHMDALNRQTRWFSTLPSVKPRGLPYYQRGQNEKVMLNHGLWLNVPDYDAPTQLTSPEVDELPNDNRLVPFGQYFPMCGMNLAWKSEVTVLLYHLLMGQIVEQGTPVPLPFDRFGDIWCGVLLKKVFDTVGLSAATGTPYVHHDRASNVFANLRKEAPGLEVNEHFWAYVDECPLKPGPLPDLYESLGRHVEQYRLHEVHATYFALLGRAMQRWARLFALPRSDTLKR